jgi:hypothetical protein
MTKKPPAAPKPTNIEMGGPETNRLKSLGGSESDGFNTALLNAVVSALWIPGNLSEEDRERHLAAALTAMGAFKPADEIEAMIAAQAISMYNASLECSRRAMHPDQPFEAQQGFRKAAANASRTFTELLSALDRKRGKAGLQRVVVERVVVNPGGRAIVGNVATGGPGGGGERQSSGEPRASPPGLAHDPAVGPVLPPLRSPDQERQPVPASRDAERPVPDARRKIDRASHG